MKRKVSKNKALEKKNLGEYVQYRIENNLYAFDDK